MYLILMNTIYYNINNILVRITQDTRAIKIILIGKQIR